MFKRQWIYLSNPFLSATKGNYIKGLQISTFTNAALDEADSNPDILALYNFYHPIHDGYVQRYNAWLAHNGTQKSKTATLQQLLDQSTKFMEQWELNIAVALGKGTPAYTALLPKGKTPFNKGKQTDRLAAFHALSTNLTGITALASTKTAVDAYYADLVAANNTQKGSFQATDSLSDALEDMRVTMGEGLMRVYGGLVQKYFNNMEQVGSFFDQEKIRESLQTVFTGTLKEGVTKTIVKRKLEASKKLVLENPGTVNVMYYLANVRNGQPTGSSFQLIPNDRMEIYASQFGDLNNTYLMVKNLSYDMPGSYRVTIG